MTEDQYGLSPMQQGMLFHTLYEPHAGLYLEQFVFDFADVALDVAAFRRSWERVVARHPSLKASFHWESREQPVQCVHPDAALPFDFQDWRDLPPDEQKRRLDAHVQADRERGFTLTEPPLARLTVLRMGQSHHQCLWTFHHLLLDGRSAVLILREVFSFYDALTDGSRFEPPSPGLYREHIARLERLDRREAEAFWRETLKGFGRSTPFAVDRPVNGTYTGPPAEQETSLPAEVSDALRALAERHELTLNTFVQGAWALLLGRYSGEDDIVFGATRACRRSTVEDADTIVGVFLHTVPIRVRIPWDRPLCEWLKSLRARQIALRKFENTPLIDIQKWSEVPPGMPLFESVLDFADYSLTSVLRSMGPKWETSTLEVREKTNYALTVYASAEPDLLLRIGYDPRRFDDDAIRRMLGHLKTLLEGMAVDFSRRVGEVPLLSDLEERQILVEWNRTAADYPRSASVHQLFEAQVARTPESVAVCFKAEQLTYRELGVRSNQLARYLGRLGVGPGVRVGISIERSLEMIVALLGILKAGGVYVPLDPAHPPDRLAFILEDASAEVLVTQTRLANRFAARGGAAVCLDRDWDAIREEPGGDLDIPVSPDDPAYVIYTSGSTGQPKGVTVSHRNVVNFFAGMDPRVGNGSPGVWLALTTISFDISVLELFWTLARGFKVVIQSVVETSAPPQGGSFRRQRPGRRVDFSLFYFASNEGDGTMDKYRLLLEGAKFADRHGFSAVWTPERHFHAFGGLYPNPSVTGAAVAALTRRVQIRAGSVVLPLQNPLRVAEEWAVVDNISGGRAAVSFASGWHANDFVLAPDNYAARKEITFREVETVRRLWRGESLSFRNGAGQNLPVRIYPQPVQPELPIWITAAGDPETFRIAGRMGARLLTHLLGHTIEALAGKLAVYRQAWRDAGHEGEGYVTVMLHTFVGDDSDAVRDKVREPLMDYLKTSSQLVRQLASSFDNDRGLDALSEREMEELHHHAFERFFRTSGLLGTTGSCLAMIERLRKIEVDEVACLIDFGVDFDSVMKSLESLDRVRQASQGEGAWQDFSIPAQIRRHGVTHLQCTPSMARMLAMDPDSRNALKPLRKLLLGGEALPPALADELLDVVSGEILNMYGPTETTVWSTTSIVRKEEMGKGSVPIGRPIANTQVYILDRRLRPTPVGVSGELFIGGDGVACGYHDRPELTAEKFLDDPFAAGTRRRMYRTGDLARYLPDGTIEFLGRLDHQVKLRGHRIELGEIEGTLERYLGVREAAVVAREDPPGDRRLIAYVVPESGEMAMADELRGYLKSRLPMEMVPAAFVMLDALPRTPNGKLDRRALPLPDPDRPRTEAAFVSPRTELETKLAAIWEKILGVAPVGVRDNFFELGGHSLLAVALFGQIEKTFGKSFPLATLFRGPTIEELAMILGQDEPSTGWSPLVPVQPHGSRPPLFFIHAEGGNVLEYYPLARRLGPDQPFYALQSEMLNRPHAGPPPRIEDLAARYIREIRAVQPTGPYFIGGFCLGGHLAYETARQLNAQGDEVARAIMIQTATVDYPEYRTGVTFIHRVLYRLIKRAHLEWTNVRAVEPKRRIPHLLGRVKQAFRNAQVGAETWAHPWLVRLNLDGWHSLDYKLAAIGQCHVQSTLNYVPEPHPDFRIVHFRATYQPLGIVPDPTMGWGRLLGDRLELHAVRAHHQNILIEPAVGSLSEGLRACLKQARDGRVDEAPEATRSNRTRAHPIIPGDEDQVPAHDRRARSYGASASSVKSTVSQGRREREA